MSALPTPKITWMSCCNGQLKGENVRISDPVIGRFKLELVDAPKPKRNRAPGL